MKWKTQIKLDAHISFMEYNYEIPRGYKKLLGLVLARMILGVLNYSQIIEDENMYVDIWVDDKPIKIITAKLVYVVDRIIYYIFYYPDYDMFSTNFKERIR